MPFLSLTPQNDIPLDVGVAITTKEESPLIKHPNILIFHDKMDPKSIVKEATQIISARGKRWFNTIIVGVDPGKTTGIAVLGDDYVLETCTFPSLEEAANKIIELSKRGQLKKKRVKAKVVKVGDGVPVYTKELLRLIDNDLPDDYIIEVVIEKGTSRFSGDTPHRRSTRDVMAAVRIAERNGRVYARMKA